MKTVLLYPYYDLASKNSHSEQQFQIDTIIRKVGEHKPGQCIWAELISKATGGEQVLSMQNDTNWAPIDLLHCLVLKSTLNIPTIEYTVKFLRYLLAIAKQINDLLPVIVFVHSQGAIYIEHAIEHLSPHERMLLRVFTFGGGSFLAPGKAHPDSHNYASAADFVCRFASSNFQLLALERYYGYKERLDDGQIIAQLALRDAMLYLDSNDINAMKAFIKQRIKHETEFSMICNLTILHPDPDCKLKHMFKSVCYQEAIQKIIKKHQR